MIGLGTLCVFVLRVLHELPEYTDFHVLEMESIFCESTDLADETVGKGNLAALIHLDVDVIRKVRPLFLQSTKPFVLSHFLTVEAWFHSALKNRVTTPIPS